MKLLRVRFMDIFFKKLLKTHNIQAEQSVIYSTSSYRSFGGEL